MPKNDGPLTSQFTADQIEIALSTLADLYANSDSTGEYLSSVQQEIAELVRRAKADIDDPEAEGTAVTSDLTVREIHYLARCVDLGRSDARASALLPPDKRDALLRKLGGRRN